MKTDMRAALLLSVMFFIFGLAALFGVPAIHVLGKPVLGVLGFALSLLLSAVPPLMVLGWRKSMGKRMAAVRPTDVSPNKSLERTRER
jgi:hypothetical protein